MGRGPVFEQRGSAIPAFATVELLQVCPAGAAARNDVPGVLGFGLQSMQFLRAFDATQRAAQLREAPVAAAEVAGETAVATLHHVGETRWGATKGTHAAPPDDLRAGRGGRIEPGVQPGARRCGRGE